MRDANATETTGARLRYVGPTAARIAGLLPQPVRFEQGWFSTAAVCHGSPSDRLQFRQRPHGEGIDARCRRADGQRSCSVKRVIAWLELLTGQVIWSAYADAPAAEAEPPAAASTRRLLALPVLVLLLALPLMLGYGFEAAALNAAGFGWAAWLMRRLARERRQTAAKRRRT